MKELATYVTDVTYMSPRYVESDEHGKRARRIAELESDCADAEDGENETAEDDLFDPELYELTRENERDWESERLDAS